jgi:hypothetical protein
MVVVGRDLEAFRKEFNSLDGVVARKIYEINSCEEDKIRDALDRKGFKSPFNVNEAKQRIKDNFYFIVVEKNEKIIGWSWAGVGNVYFGEFNCKIKLKKDEAFSFNTYVAPDFRGLNVNQITLNEKLSQLKKDGYRLIWGLIYPWNKSSLRSFEKNRWNRLGNFYFLRILFIPIIINTMRFRKSTT